jgi:hypothetical protein
MGRSLFERKILVMLMMRPGPVRVRELNGNPVRSDAGLDWETFGQVSGPHRNEATRLHHHHRGYKRKRYCECGRWLKRRDRGLCWSCRQALR